MDAFFADPHEIDGLTAQILIRPIDTWRLISDPPLI